MAYSLTLLYSCYVVSGSDRFKVQVQSALKKCDYLHIIQCSSLVCFFFCFVIFFVAVQT